MSVLLPSASASPRAHAPRLSVAGLLGLAGSRVELWTDEPATLAPFLAAHRHFGPGADRDGTRELRTEVLAGGVCAQRPKIRFPGLPTGQLRGLLDRGPEGRFAPIGSASGNGVVLYQDRLLGLEPALACGPDGCEVLEPQFLGSYLELLILNAALDGTPSLAAAHAAVVARGSRAALVCGDGGAGKSTLVLSLLRRGCAYLSDEVALLDLAAGRVQAYPRSLGIREGSLSLIGEQTIGADVSQVTTLAGDRKWLLDPGEVGTAGICHEAVPAHLWFLSGFGPEPRITEMDPWEATRRLARSLREVRGAGLDRLWTAMEVVRRCRVREVIAGPPDVTAEVLIRLMEVDEGEVAGR